MNLPHFATSLITSEGGEGCSGWCHSRHRPDSLRSQLLSVAKQTLRDRSYAVLMMMNRWRIRAILLGSLVMCVFVIFSGWTAFGGPLGFLPTSLQTGSGSPSGSASPSSSPSSCTVPLPPLCPSPTSSGSASPTPTASRSASPTPTASRSSSPSPSGSPAPRESHDSTVTISYSDRHGIFSGRVSSVSKCESRRVVALRRVRKGADPFVFKDVTDSAGRWKIDESRANGRYYAKVSKRVFTEEDGTEVTCESARSRTIRA